ncbi:MAG TPA: response regulator transcription factor [Streptosporangiaceae bacterium]|jgi:DNA-binding NarL/FixJ family response regulator/class 3 adenylate cyclase|nr:response regulator transcription factor [Streptosporangiaceae bacterium]
MTELTGAVVVVDCAVVPQASHISRALERESGNPQLADLRALVRYYQGETVSTLAGWLVAAFPVPSGAIKFAIAAQQQAANAPADGLPSAGLKVGISVGEIVRTADSCRGRAATEATRLCQLAEPGHILSAAAVLLIAESARDVDAEQRGSHLLGGLPGPVEVDEIIWPRAASRPLRALLADDAVLIRQGVASLLEEAGIAVVGQAGDAAAIVELAAALAPDVLITDVRMPPTFTLEGLRAAIELRARSPQIAVLVLSQHLETRYAVELLGEGASGVGYLLKERVTAVEEFISAVRRVARGGTAIDPEMVSLLIGRSQRDRVLTDLSQRQEEILSLMAQGLSNSGIARRLTLGIRTVESHVSSIFTKLGLIPQADDERRVLAVLQKLRS